MRCVVAGQVPVQVVKTKLTSTTLSRSSHRRSVLPSCVVSAKSGAARMTASRPASAASDAARSAPRRG
jgi:hypothetical protein